MKQIFGVLTVMGTIAFVSSATSDTSARAEERFDDVLSFSLRVKDFDSEKRRELVNLLHRYCDYAIATIPTNTPKEDAWVQAEIDAVIVDSAHIDRAIRLESTPEFGRWTLRRFFSDCQEVSEHFINWYATHPDSTNFTESERSTETGLMALLALQLNDEQRVVDNMGKVEIDQDSRFVRSLDNIRIVRSAVLKSAVQSTVIHMSWQ